jgi:putative ABC transport system ATP-binding protein
MIELHGVSKTVPSGDTMLTILHPLDLRIEAGRVAAIVGPSGSGKSTLLGLLAGLDSPTTGRIVIDDADLTTMSEDDLARFRGKRIGFVFQFFHLLPSLTALENVRVPLEIAGAPDPGRRADALLHEVGLGPRRHHYLSAHGGITIHPNCPAASSSASRSRGRWRTIRRSCSRTNRRETSTAGPATR